MVPGTQELLESNADPDSKNHDGRTALGEAAANGHQDVAKVGLPLCTAGWDRS